MIPIASLILVLSISLLLTRIATVALVHTGMGREAARFQARSAFTGVGFTTSEAESIAAHPVRRRIVMWLMLVGNVGLVTAVASLMLSVFGMSGMGPDDGSRWPVELLLLVGGVLLLLLVASSAWVDRHLSRIISWALRRFTEIDARDYASLLHLRDDYGIAELCVQAEDWIVGKTLREARLASEGLLVLGVSCPGGSFIGAPAASTQMRAGDSLIVYGRRSCVSELDERVPGDRGDRSHQDAVRAQRRISEEEHSRAGR
jgi:hypothetical protein